MSTTKSALDTNVLIYSHSQDDLFKQDIARNLIVRSPVVSTQVLSEYINVLKRVMSLSKKELLSLCIKTFAHSDIYPVGMDTLKAAEQIIQRYDLQIFDSIVVAAAIEAGCDVLYTEDMSHNLVINNQLTIINPFL
ncbi:MAG: PIN domain-containing protein [Prevotellaceae bacterium]|jgi:predicted nucleic acid-binding protein|nr:PIN domain-containing protein [Prevotellaceae bacterium]